MTKTKFGGRWYHRVAVEDVAPGDVIRYVDQNERTRRVMSVTAKFAVVDRPGVAEGQRISRAAITEVWRRGAEGPPT